jgi:hypothetical protein
MSHVAALRNIVGFFERATLAIVGFVLMVLGLALGVTILLLPAGLVIGLTGVALVIAALFADLDQQRSPVIRRVPLSTRPGAASDRR